MNGVVYLSVPATMPATTNWMHQSTREMQPVVMHIMLQACVCGCPASSKQRMAGTVGFWPDQLLVNADTRVWIHVASSPCLPFAGSQA